MLMITLCCLILIASSLFTLSYFIYLNNKARKNMHEYL